jgi:hypothetical protein
VTCLAACTSFVSRNEVAAQIPGVQHVVVTGVDSLSPDGIRKVASPQVHKSMKVGASTLHARAMMPTVSSPNWASVIMEAGAEHHAITTNDWELNKFEIRPTAVGSGGTSLTIFGVLHSQ